MWILFVITLMAGSPPEYERLDKFTSLERCEEDIPHYAEQVSADEKGRYIFKCVFNATND